MTVGAGKDKIIMAGTSEVTTFKVRSDQGWLWSRGQGEKVTQQRRFNLYSTGFPEVFKTKETLGVPSWPWQRQN